MSEDEILFEINQHPTIGSIRGIHGSNRVNQYLGIQYAKLKDRFSRGMICQYDYPPNMDNVLDATKHGPIPLSPVNGCEWEQTLLQKSLPFSPFQQSDTECLTLNIAAPNINESSRLPVMAFVHGGAFATGSSSYPQYDLAPITKLSVEMGTPIVAVSINYRLGVPGFLHCPEMKAIWDHKPNNGLDDQRIALQWIRNNIAGFGGDPERVTFIGESAGGASGCFHMQSADPLFHQLVAMSGTSLLRPRRREHVEKAFTTVVEMLGAKDLPLQEQLTELLDTPKESFVVKVTRQSSIGPIVDGDIIPQATTFESLEDEDELIKMFPAIRHCKRIIMGDCQMDSSAFTSRIAGRMDILPKTLESCLSSVFDPIDVTIAPAIVSAYGLKTSATSNTPETTKAVLDFGNDVSFALPARSFTRSWSSSSVPGTAAFLYHFNCPNPWDGPWKGHAIHIQDIAFVFQNYKDHLSLGQQQSGERFARDIITFVNGDDPWPAYENGVKPGSMVYYAPTEGDKDESKFIPDETSEHTGRNYILQNLLTAALFDKLADAWQLFMQSPR